MRGRTYRKRRLRLKLLSSDAKVDSLYDLSKWMGERGFKPVKKLKPKVFNDTGRGLMTEENIRPGDVIITIPIHLLITPSVVLTFYLGEFFKRYHPKATGHEILSVFLMCEYEKRESSDWHPYILSLPKTYSIPVCFCHHTLNFLPKPVNIPAKLQCESVNNSFIQLKPLFMKLQANFPIFKDILNYELYKWAWSSVNTRCIFMECLENCCGTHCTYHLALAPYLDLLNHSVDVQVHAGFNKEKNQYEIISHNKYKKYSQVFISYGCHENQKLFLEYGFVAENNYNDFIRISIDDILAAYKLCNLPLNAINPKLKYIEENNLLKNAICSKDGISWNLHIILRILISEYNIKLWNTLIHDAYNEVDTPKFQKLKQSLIKLKIDEYTWTTLNLNCSDCSSHQYIVSKLCLILNSILIKALL